MCADDVGVPGRGQHVFVAVAHTGCEIPQQSLGAVARVHYISDCFPIVERNVRAYRVKRQTLDLDRAAIDFAGRNGDDVPTPAQFEAQGEVRIKVAE